MNNQISFTPIQRELYINARSLILRALDLMDKAYQVGKYKPPVGVTITQQDSIAGVVMVSEPVTEKVERI